MADSLSYLDYLLVLDNKIIPVQFKLNLYTYNHKTIECYFSYLSFRCDNQNEIQLHPLQQQGISPKKGNDTLVPNFNKYSKTFSMHS